MRALHLMLCLTIAVGIPEQAHTTSSAVYINATGGVVIANERGSLDYWVNGGTKPLWSVPIGGIGIGARSRVATMQIDGDNNLLVVERFGAIRLFSLKGEIIGAKLPVYSYVKLDIPFSNPDNWEDHVKEIEHSSAAYLLNGKDLFLGPNITSEITSVNSTDVLNSSTDAVEIGEFWRLFYDEETSLVVTIRRDGEIASRSWPLSERDLHPTALTVCGSTIITGTEEGFVSFNSTTDMTDAERRLRQIGTSDEDGVQNVIDAGCIGSDMAFTVAFQSANGQIQLWDLTAKAMLDSVGYDSDGHPGMAFAAVGSRSGKYLLSLGDGDIRLWSLEGRKLKLLRPFELSMNEQSQAFAVAATEDDGFIYWDGSRVWMLSANSVEPTLFAGEAEQ
jgi:WD40 repeat protein